MTTFDHYADRSILYLIETLNNLAEAGIDPAFDTDMEELERQFAEFRLSHRDN